MTPLPGPILWRRLDLPGHDAACVRPAEGGVALTGAAVFLEGAPTALHYTVRCDAGWRTTDAVVRGWRGAEPVELRLRRDPSGDWSLNGHPCPGVAGCLDLDLSFTPATNLLPLRRLDLTPGAQAEVRSAWLEWPAMRLSPLVQRYACLSPEEYDYRSDPPGNAPFRTVLRVQRGGWVLDYGGLWRAEGPA
jgi:hypothetical protein